MRRRGTGQGERRHDGGRRRGLEDATILAFFAAWALAGPVFAALLNVPPDAIGATSPGTDSVSPGLGLHDRGRMGSRWLAGAAGGRRAALACSGRGGRRGRSVPVAPGPRGAHRRARDRHGEHGEVGPAALGHLWAPATTGCSRSFTPTRSTWCPDVTYIDPHLLGHDWYRARSVASLGASTSARRATPIAFGRAGVLARGGWSCWTDAFDGQLVSVFLTYPIGTPICLLARDATCGLRPSAWSRRISACSKRSSAGTPARATTRGRRPPSRLTYQRLWVALRAECSERRRDEARARGETGERAAEWGWPDGEGRLAGE